MDVLASALARQKIVLSNSLATVASGCVVFRASTGNSQSILSFSEIRDVNTVKLSYPGLLVLAAAAGLIAAGAHFSKDGGSAEIPIALVGLLLLTSFVISRRAAVCFVSDDGLVQTVFGSLSEAAAVVKAMKAATKKMKEDSEPELLTTPLASVGG